MKEIRPIGTPDAEVTVPGSKSITNRCLMVGALAEGETSLSGALICEDTVRMMGALRDLGFLVRHDRKSSLLRILGQGGVIPAHGARISVGSSGTGLRFLTALCALGQGRYSLDGTSALRLRPMAPLIDALRAIGSNVSGVSEGRPPIRVQRGELTGGGVTLPAGVSSQFASALLLIAPYLPWGLKLRLTGSVVSAPYLDLTLDVMGRFGARAERAGPRTFRVEPAAYRAQEVRIEGDATSASYFFAAAAVTGGRVRVKNLPADSRQGDLAMLDLLQAMGATAARGSDWAEVAGGRLRGIDANLKSNPDLAPTLAAVAAVAKGRTRIRGVPHLRAKESDRIQAAVGAVRALGGKARAFRDGLSVEGGEVRPGVVDPMGDHRIAMAFAVLGLRRPGVKILTPEVVGKSFPDFFSRLAML